MKNENKCTKGIYWVKYIGFWISFGAIFEILGLNFNMAAIVAIVMVIFVNL